MPQADIRSELKALTDEFFKAVSFESGQKPSYATIRDLFVEDGKLIRNSSQGADISSVEEFIASRQRLADSGAVTSFEEVETAEITELFGNVAHRFSTYKKRGTMHPKAIQGSGVISIQFVCTSSGWRMASMAWEDERPGLPIPDRYR